MGGLGGCQDRSGALSAGVPTGMRVGGVVVERITGFLLARDVGGGPAYQQ